jgi:hypothetical protein
MHAQETHYIPWRDRAFVSITEAGEIVARSPDWIRNRIGEGRLEIRRLSAGGPAVVTVDSLLRLIDGAQAAEPQQPTKRRAPRPKPAKPMLRLIINNDL